MSQAENAGTISAKIRLELDEMEKDGLQAQKMMDSFAEKFKELGEKGGIMYVKGFGQGQLDLNEKLNSFVSTMQEIHPKVGAIASKLASVFSKPIFSMIPVVSAAFQTMLPIIGTIITAISFLIKGIASAAKKQKEFNDNVNLSREVSAKLKNTTVELSAAQEKSADITKRQEHNTAVMQVVFKKLGDFFQNIFLPIINGVRTAFTAIGNITSWVADKLGIVSRAEADAAVEAQKLKGVNEDLSKTIDDYQNKLKNIEATERSGAKTAEEAAKAKLSAMESYIDSLIQAREEKARLLNGEDNDPVKEMDTAIAARLRERDILAEQIKIGNEAKEIEKARLSAIEQYELAVKKANDAKTARHISEVDRLKQVKDAQAQQYSDLENIAAQYRNATGAAATELEKTIELRNETAQLVKINQNNEKSIENMNWLIETQANQYKEITNQTIEQLKAKAAEAKTEKEKNGYLQDAINLENNLIEKQREIEKQALINSESFKAQSKETKEQILSDFDEITDGMMKLAEDEGGKGKSNNWLANAMGLTDKQLGNMMKVGEAAISAYETISESILEASRKHAEEQMAIIDKALEQTLASIEKARQEELIAAGFAVENNIESLEAQLEAAKRTGDEVLIYQMERRLEEQRINDEFDAQAKAAEEEAARQKAEIEFKMAKQEHTMKLISAINAGAMAVVNALSSGLPPLNFILAGLVGAAAGVQVAMIASNPPTMPHFANSGIVPGNKFFGDRNVAAVDSGELILNRAHQDNIAGQLTNGGGTHTVTATIVVMLDGREIGQNTFDLANKGHYTLKTRVIQG